MHGHDALEAADKGVVRMRKVMMPLVHPEVFRHLVAMDDRVAELAETGKPVGCANSIAFTQPRCTRE